MKKKEFLDLMGNIDDELLLRAEKKNKSKRGIALKIGIFAAVICAIFVITLAILIPGMKNGKNNASSGVDNELDTLTAPISDVYWVDTRERNGNNTLSQEKGIVWPWNCRAVYNQYTQLFYNGNEYSARSSYYGGEVYANQIGDKLAEVECKGFDMIREGAYSIGCSIYRINGVDSDVIVAVKYDGFDGYYAFINESRKAPATLEALINRLNLTENIKLNSFYYSETPLGEEKNYYLNNETSEELWNIIKKYANAKLIDSKTFDYSKKKLSFAVSSNTLGVYNLSFSLSEDGFLFTNIENYGYCYAIGEGAVNEIFSLALKNKTLNLLPEKQYTVGTVTEIGESYIKVDDSIVMKNADEGIEFTVYAEHMNIRRYIISGYLKVGDTVSVEHGYLPKEGYTEIRNATNLEECIITSGGEVLIPE
jgi:hypothetical protein